MPEKKKKYKIICDTREKQPLSFEHEEAFDGVIYKKLDSGDYSLEGFEHLVAIERKHNINEIFGNVYTRTNLDRFIREIERMPKHRFILIEQEFEDLFDPANFYVNILAGYRRGKYNASRRNKTLHPDIPRIIMMRRLTEFMIKYDVKVMFVGKRAAEIIKYILLEVANNYPSGTNP